MSKLSDLDSSWSQSVPDPDSSEDDINEIDDDEMDYWNEQEEGEVFEDEDT